MVPPEHPAYRIRRVWLSKEEEQGYYFGFANEGLWPLCHIAHTRPTFRTQDWEHYRNVNQRFADIVADEARTEDPIILVQDYHFALLPRMVRERLPRATIITFWHIPWPNPEAFGILPGARRSSRACSAPRSSASTPSSTATTSSTRPTASSKRASTARPSRSPTAATDRGAPLPDLDRMAAGGAAAPGAGAGVPQAVRERLGSAKT
jgi:trehalose 6-phosphate synthase